MSDAGSIPGQAELRGQAASSGAIADLHRERGRRLLDEAEDLRSEGFEGLAKVKTMEAERAYEAGSAADGVAEFIEALADLRRRTCSSGGARS